MTPDTTGPTPFARVEPNDGSWDDLIIDEAAPFHLMLKDAHQAARRLNSAVAARERAAFDNGIEACPECSGSRGSGLCVGDYSVEPPCYGCAGSGLAETYYAARERAAEAKALREAADAERKLMKHWEALAARYHERGQLQYLAVARAEIDRLLASEGRLRSRADAIEGGK